MYFYFVQTHSLQDLQQPAVSSKVFIQRDYSSGTICKFQTKLPSELESRVGLDRVGIIISMLLAECLLNMP